jgi:uncharacterized protein YcfJ
MSISISRKMLAGAIAATLVIASASSFAQDRRHDDRPYYGDRDDPRYDTGTYDYARVIDVEPLTRRVRVSTPQRECWDEVRQDDRGQGVRSPAGGAILGAVIGGVLGSQIGSGRGRDAATAAGVVIGAGMGHRQAERRNAENGAPPREYTVQRCETRYQDTLEERIDGYRVTYEYHGRRHVTEMPYNPGQRIRVRVDVSPAE